MQRFYSHLGLSKPANWRGLYKAYCMEKIYLFNTEQITFITSKYGAAPASSRQFKYRYLEPLRFWNSDVSFVEKKYSTEKYGVEIKKNDGSVHFIDTKGKNSDEIFKLVLEKTEGRKVPISIPPQ
ncbi:hypothetical protein DFA_12054 [Cavenderia fasciculata]|uniref:Ribosomal protein/NADH dehydrogenase domain-containing protein n=1 Tax=Cavenderia fasciculata TaxID=261658 RepID=F4QFI3_CACFS|nr:uncharacterized protein DFA_12054 [Cavenderia fasciculata]EGG14284.1 hypothetical protein DFA_12054 [Cavenderia fasciculata]|eukprot:XP_004350993.1 hypothetical protein DFA_12054 [Cavenderia fasciculata]